jgi:PadR family transcriptional regulator PadR
VIRDFFLGFVRVHILHHAKKGPIFGLDMIRELETHGYHLSPGTLYPMLHNLEANGLLVSSKAVVSGKVRKYYRATELGEKVLEEAIVKANELLMEIQE